MKILIKLSLIGLAAVAQTHAMNNGLGEDQELEQVLALSLETYEHDEERRILTEVLAASERDYKLEQERRDIEAKKKKEDPKQALNESLFKAFKKRDMDEMCSLLDKGADINARSVHGSTLLLLATLQHKKPVLEFLIQKGADVNASNNQGYTPLMYAAHRTSIDKLQLLVEKGAHINARNNKGETALSIACRNYYNPHFIEYLTSQGADINTQDNNGRSALMETVYTHPDSFKMLLAHNPDLMLRDNSGHTIFTIIQRRISDNGKRLSTPSECMQLLIEHVKKIEAENRNKIAQIMLPIVSPTTNNSLAQLVMDYYGNADYPLADKIAIPFTPKTKNAEPSEFIKPNKE